MNLETLFLNNQTWTYTDVQTIYGHKVRVTIERNAYDNQSHIYTQILDLNEKKWNMLDSVGFTKELKCFNVSYVGKATVKDFKYDAEMMFDRAREILAPVVY